MFVISHSGIEKKIYASHRYLIPVTERQPEGSADALYAFKSRGFGGEIGLVLVRKNKKVPRGKHGSPTDDDSDQSSSEGGGLAGQCV